MNKIGESRHAPAALYAESVPTFTGLERSALPAAPMAMFIAADALAVPDGVVLSVALRLLDAGVVVVCVWGPDCERVHDIVDDAYVGDGTVGRSQPLITTWHADESLADALEFFVINSGGLAQPATLASQLAVAVGEAGWAAEIGAALVRFCR